MRKYLICFALLLVGCGGSGGGGNDGPDDVEPPLVILENYNFFLGNLNNGELLTANVGGDFTVTIDLDDGLLAGNLDLDVGANNTVTFLSYLLRAGNSFVLTVTSPEGSELDGTFRVSVMTDIEAAVDEPPISGAVMIQLPDVLEFGVTILADGVELTSLAGTEQYTWEEFAALLDDEQAAGFRRQAALSFGVIEFLVEQFFNVADVLDDLELVTLNNPYIETCDMFTGSPPQGILAEGNVTITWLGSGELSDGDDFTWAFENCWSQDDEELLDGTVTLEDYTESVDFNTGILFNIGFGGLGAGEPGGVIFDLTFSETVEGQGVWTIPTDGVITVSGGLVLNIQEP
ncbi:MAG: hypothetical protein OES10_09260 [Gammaproteobacteria bacterium]|nr:hypothetical protein [Gammaproteobacteria bacterium]